MSNGLTHRVTVRNPEGLHLRPADQLVRMAGRFESNILIGKLPCGSVADSLVADASSAAGHLSMPSDADDSAIMHIQPGEMLDCKSIMSLLTLGAAQGDILTLSADGPDATKAIEHISRWFESGFDDSLLAGDSN